MIVFLAILKAVWG